MSLTQTAAASIVEDTASLRYPACPYQPSDERRSDPSRRLGAPTIGLEDALAILLALLDREPQSFSRTAARWGARLTIERRLPLADAQLTLASRAVLPGAGARAGAEALIELTGRHGLRRVDELLVAWLHARGIGE